MNKNYVSYVCGLTYILLYIKQGRIPVTGLFLNLEWN